MGISLEFPWNFPGIPLGIQWNPQEFDIPTIPVESEWNSNILWDSAGIRQNSWRRVKYWIEVALNKWKTGVLVHLIFDEKIYQPIFIQHLQDLCHWLEYITTCGTLLTKTLQFDLCTNAWSVISSTWFIWHTNINCKRICWCNESGWGWRSTPFFCWFWRQWMKITPSDTLPPPLVTPCHGATSTLIKTPSCHSFQHLPVITFTNIHYPSLNVYKSYNLSCQLFLVLLRSMSYDDTPDYYKLLTFRQPQDWMGIFSYFGISPKRGRVAMLCHARSVEIIRYRTCVDVIDIYYLCYGLYCIRASL